MSDFEKNPEQWEAFQKIWLETFSKLGETAFTFNPQSAPPEVLRHLRNGILQALSKSWEEFLRSPQFLEGMKKWMDGSLQFQSMTNDFLAKARQQTGGVARPDVDSVLMAVEHLERRLLDRIEEVARQVDQLQKAGPRPRRPRQAGPARQKPRRQRKGKRS